MPDVSSRAVFLSYASQDADAAKRICEALRAAGADVWFDQSELRGGDAWDAKIRKQIKACALFVPIISANTQARPEGYFRLEWKLAVDRSHLMADDQPFLLPVVIDDTPEPAARVPDRFREVQWVRLTLRDTPESLALRITRLLAGAADPATPALAPATGRGRRRNRGRRSPWIRVTWVVLGITFTYLYAVRPIFNGDRARGGSALPAGNVRTSAGANGPAANGGPTASERGDSPARVQTQRARQILDRGSLTRAQLDAAGELCDHAVQLDPTDPLVWATAADVELHYIYPYGYDRSDARRHRAEERAARASTLGPDLFEVRLIQAEVFAHAVGTPALMAEAEKTIRALRAARPDDPELVRQLAEVLREEKRFDEAAQLFESVGEHEVAGWSYFQAGKLRSALAAVGRGPRSVTALQLKATLEYGANEDLDAAEAVVNQFQPSELLAEMPASIAIRIAMYRRDPQRTLELAQGIAKDFIDSNAFHGPRGYFTGLAYEMAGRPAQAESEWRAALALVQTKLNAAPDDRVLLQWSAWLHASLQDTAEAERSFARSQALAGLSGDTIDMSDFQAVLSQVRVLLRLRKTEALLTGLEKVFRARLPDWELVHAELRFGPEADFLRGDPRFEKLLRDNLPAGAKPFPEAVAPRKP